MKARALLLLAIPILAAACDSHGPDLQGFSCGGFGGAVCPPASTCDPCQGEDCGSPCYATTPCNPPSSASDCPAGTSCDSASGYCMPEATCTADADCAAGELCVHRSNGPLSKPICMVVEATPPPSCDSCPFPWSCLGGACVYSCNGQTCPGTLTCVNQTCVP